MTDARRAGTSNKAIVYNGLSMRKRFIRYYELFLMLLIPIAYYIIFHYIPMYGLSIAFKEYNLMKGVMDSPWIGMTYFKQVWSNPMFWMAFMNTLIISALKLVITFPAPIVLALLLNELRNLKFKKIVQTVSYLPHFISWVVLSAIVINFLSPSVGPLNAIIKMTGNNAINFVAEKRYFRSVLILSSLWKGVGWGTIVYLAAFSSINPELYEAAVIDGAGRLRQTINVTIPSIMHVVIIMLIFAIGGIINDDFDQIYNLYNDAVVSVAEVISTYVYKIGLLRMNYSFGAAVGMFKNVIAFTLIILTNAVAKKVSDYGIW